MKQSLPLTEENYKKGSLSVWWDLSVCQLPLGDDPHRITDLVANIRSALECLGYVGRVDIYAYGDSGSFETVKLEALRGCGIIFTHITFGAKKTISKQLMDDMLYWPTKNQKPANIMLLSDDEDLLDMLQQLRRNKFNTLLAVPRINGSSLVVAANTIWQWGDLSSGRQPNTVNPTICLPSVENPKGKGKSRRS